jgi:outer membrane protein assembly factor BamD
MKRNWLFNGILLLVAVGLLGSCGFRRKKYENPITKDTQQPDKVLFDKAIADVERGRYEIARLTLNTLMNTYDQSEYLAKAKLAIADTWYREGGSHGLAQAEAEYKDFILFYPTMEEAAEAQEKVCMIHFKQMEKPDRDNTHAIRAEEECRQLLTQFPNSKFAPQGQQILRNIQEVVAEGEFRVGAFYHTKGVLYSAANRLQGMTDHFPLYSKADEALWLLGDSYERMGPRFRDRSAEAYGRIAREYPLSAYAEDAKQKLKDMEKPIPEPDPVSLARQKYEQENRDKPGMMSHFWGVFRRGPDVWAAAKSGEPPMESMRPAIPATVPVQAAGGANADVSATTITGQSALDTQPDARTSTPKSAGDAAQPAAGQQAQTQTQDQNQQQSADKKSKKKSKAKKDDTSKKKSKRDQKSQQG